MDANKSKIKVIVIGAGISGLGCASTLVKENDLFEVTVLEARDARI
jgi:protoporphyrinogen oxidase